MRLIINWKNFLQHHWQKRPVLLKEAISDFINPVSPEELEKLVIEKALDSQLIENNHGKYQLVHKPFNGYVSLGQRNWSLRVGAIHHWHRAAEEFLSLFRIFPDWVKEELMVFFSVPGGRIGPQTKPSDVLIIQGMGRSRWRVGDRWSSPDVQNDFSESIIINEELSAGDILYIPKDFPHEVISSETALSYSLSFWTDNSLLIIRNWTESLADDNHKGIEYSPSPDLILRDDPTEILPQDISALQNMMNQFLLQNREHLENWFVQEMSQTSYELSKAPEAEVYSPSQVQTLLQRQGSRLKRLMGLRMLHIGNRYFVNGEALSSDYTNAWNILARHRTIEGPMLSHMTPDSGFMTQLTVLINQGYWYFYNK